MSAPAITWIILVAFYVGMFIGFSLQKRADADEAVSEKPSIGWQKACIYARARAEKKRLEGK